MFETKHLNITSKTRAAIMRLQRARGDYRKPEWVVEDAFQVWIEKIVRDDPQAAQAETRGYQWKSLFLPEGTRVRFQYKRETFYADVRGDELVYHGRAYSPRQLLLHVTGTVRNAWRELWLRCPGDFRWHLADTRRLILRRVPTGRHPRGVDVASHNDMTRYKQQAEQDRALATRGGPVGAGASGSVIAQAEPQQPVCRHRQKNLDKSAKVATDGECDDFDCNAFDCDASDEKLGAQCDEVAYFLNALVDAQVPDATGSNPAACSGSGNSVQPTNPADHDSKASKASIDSIDSIDSTDMDNIAGTDHMDSMDCGVPDTPCTSEFAQPVSPPGRDALAHSCSRPADPPSGATSIPGGIAIGIPPYRFPCAVHGASLRAILYRDDLVRDDQPDLSCGSGGGGRAGAGRSGPRDRRWTG